MGNVCFGKKRVAVRGQRDTFGYRDLEKEFTHEICKIQGEIPKWIAGKLYRQTGGAFLPGGIPSLDGLGHVACYEIDGSKLEAKFTNRFYNSAYYQKWKECGDRAWDIAGANSTGEALLTDKRSVVDGNFNVTFWRWSKDQSGDKGDCSAQDSKVYVASASEFPHGECILLDDECESHAKIDMFGRQKWNMNKHGLAFLRRIMLKAKITNRKVIFMLEFL